MYGHFSALPLIVLKIKIKSVANSFGQRSIGLLILIIQTLYLKNPSDASLASLSVGVCCFQSLDATFPKDLFFRLFKDHNSCHCAVWRP